MLRKYLFRQVRKKNGNPCYSGRSDNFFNKKRSWKGKKNLTRENFEWIGIFYEDIRQKREIRMRRQEPILCVLKTA